MILKNRFKEEDKIRVWVDHQFCALCTSNKICSLHHIDGTVSDSIYGSIMLCFLCHKNADGHNVSDEKFKEKLTSYTLGVITKSNYEIVKRDVVYLESIKKRLQNILSSL